MNDDSSRIIKSHKFFGFSLYEKKQHQNLKIDFDFEFVNCDDIGLYVIGKYPRFKYSTSSFNQDFNWLWHSIATLRLTILNLINNRVIEVYKTQNTTSYLFNTYKNQKTDYYFKVIDLQLDKDWLSVLIYKSINEVNCLNFPTLSDYIKVIINKIIYKYGVYDNPSKAFMIKTLREYSNKFSWIHIYKEKKFMGYIDDYQIKVKEIYIPRMNMQHQLLNETDNDLFHNNYEYKYFYKALAKEIIKAFKSREPNKN